MTVTVSVSSGIEAQYAGHCAGRARLNRLHRVSTARRYITWYMTSRLVSHAGGLGLLGGGYGDDGWIDREWMRAGNARIGCGFITWSLAEHPELLETSGRARTVDSDPSTNPLREGAPRARCIEARGCITRKLPLPLPRSRTLFANLSQPRRCRLRCNVQFSRQHHPLSDEMQSISLVLIS